MEGVEKDRKFSREIFKVVTECGLEDSELYLKERVTKSY